MDIQSLIVGLVVFGSVVYASWTLMPASWRASSARGLLKLRWPARFSAYLAKAAVAPSGCGCSGCDANPAASAPGGRRASSSSRKIIPIRQVPKR